MMMDVRELVTKFSFQVNSEAVTKFISLLKEAETSLDNLGKKTNIKIADVKLQKQLAQLKTQELKMEGQSLRNQNIKLKGDWQELRNQNVKIRNEKLVNTIARQKQKEQEREQAKNNKPFLKTAFKNLSSGSLIQDAFFSIELLKTAYQWFYNIAEATRQTAVNILRTNDALNMSIAKIGVITGDTKNASKNFRELLDISAQTGSEIGVIEEIFNRLSMGKEGLGATTEQIIDFTSAIAKMSAFSEGGPAQQGALRQLGQMFGGAYIQAQEWNSIVDGLPAVASKIAKAMGTTREAMTFKIRQQTKDSPAYLISDVFPKLLKILPEIESEFSKLPPTLDRTLNKASVGLLGFSLNLKESVNIPELDGFYSQLDGTIKKIFEWANANKILIGTNINTFFGTLNDALKSVDNQLKDTKGTAETLDNVFWIINGTVKNLKLTFDILLWTLNAVANTMKFIAENSTSGGIGGFSGTYNYKTAGFERELNKNPSLNSNLVNKVLPLAGMLNRNPQSVLGNKVVSGLPTTTTNINIASLGAGVTQTQAKQIGQSLATGYNKVGTLKGAFA